MGALAGLGGQRPVLGFVLGDQFAGGGAARRVQGSGVGFLGGGFGEPGGYRLALLSSRCLDRFLDLGGTEIDSFRTVMPAIVAPGRNMFLPGAGGWGLRAEVPAGAGRQGDHFVGYLGGRVREHNAIDGELARIIQRPMTSDHLGEWAAVPACIVPGTLSRTLAVPTRPHIRV
jgi:hypothetical protein